MDIRGILRSKNYLFSDLKEKSSDSVFKKAPGDTSLDILKVIGTKYA